MKIVEVSLPYDLTFQEMCSFAEKLHQIPNCDKVTVDFGSQRWFPPSAMVFLYQEIKRCRTRLKETRFVAKNHKRHSYPAYFGFFQSIGLDYGNMPNSIDGTSTYIPIRTIKTSDWLSDLKYVGVSEHIDNKCRQLSSILGKGQDAALREFLHFEIRELVRNVFEHAEAKELVFTAQYWPQHRKAEIVLSDDGIGLLNTVSRNNILEVANDHEAVDAALLPGVSGSIRYRNNDDWDNSGYGLFMTSELSRQLGEFFICSGNCGLLLKGDERQYCTSSWPGTFISLSFSVREQLDLEKFRLETAQRGEELSKAKFGSKARTASRSSKG